MSKKVKHLIEFEKKDKIFTDITDENIRESVLSALPEDVGIEKCYCEYPKPYGHNPYVSIITVEQKTVVTNPQERGNTIIKKVEEGVKDVIDGKISEKRAEGWA